MEHCFTCGGLGFEDRVCPECGREQNNRSLNLDKMENVKEFVKKIGNTAIPDNYHGIFWDVEVLKKDNADKVANYSDKSIKDDIFFKTYYTQLSRINSIFTEGRIPHRSAIICAPAGYSKLTFAYSCMQRALNAGFTVAPLLDTNEVKRVLVLCGENPRYKINKYLDYDDYIMSDVMFITVTKLYNYVDAYSVIQEVFDRRTRKGLSTIVISRYGIDDIARNDKSGNFAVIKDRDSSDTYKFPAIIQYTDRIRRVGHA